MKKLSMSKMALMGLASGLLMTGSVVAAEGQLETANLLAQGGCSGGNSYRGYNEGNEYYEGSRGNYEVTSQPTVEGEIEYHGHPTGFFRVDSRCSGGQDAMGAPQGNRAYYQDQQGYNQQNGQSQYYNQSAQRPYYYQNEDVSSDVQDNSRANMNRNWNNQNANRNWNDQNSQNTSFQQNSSWNSRSDQNAISEQQLLPQLNDSTKNQYMQMSEQGKMIARQLAAQPNYTDKNKAVRDAASQVQSRGDSRLNNDQSSSNSWFK